MLVGLVESASDRGCSDRRFVRAAVGIALAHNFAYISAAHCTRTNTKYLNLGHKFNQLQSAEGRGVHFKK